MGAGHAHALYVHEHSSLHQMAPEAKLVATFGFVIAVATTPREAIWAFGVYAVMIALAIRTARVPYGFVLIRLAAVIPFVLFALLIPFVAGGERIEILGISVSRAGLWGSWNVVAKATLGASASVLLAATTEIAEMLRGLSILRVPPALTAIAMFMVRYLVLVSGELARMRVAMVARGHDPRWLWQARPIAASAGALFIRTYERGERVHAAMTARGYQGSMPDLTGRRADRSEWLLVGAFLAVSTAVAFTAGVVT